jgi:hypothetical protein
MARLNGEARAPVYRDASSSWSADLGGGGARCRGKRPWLCWGLTEEQRGCSADGVDEHGGDWEALPVWRLDSDGRQSPWEAWTPTDGTSMYGDEAHRLCVTSNSGRWGEWRPVQWSSVLHGRTTKEQRR